MKNKMEIITIKINEDGLTAKEVNVKTNVKMGKRHFAFESMLRTFHLYPYSHRHVAENEPSCKYKSGEIYQAQVMTEDYAKILQGFTGSSPL